MISRTATGINHLPKYKHLLHFRNCFQKLVYFVDLVFLCITRLALSDMPHVKSTFFIQLTVNFTLNGKNVVMSVSTQFVSLLSASVIFFCFLSSSLSAACYNHFYFSFVVDKHDIEPSHRCMPTQKVQLNAIPLLSTSLSEGGC